MMSQSPGRLGHDPSHCVLGERGSPCGQWPFQKPFQHTRWSKPQKRTLQTRGRLLLTKHSSNLAWKVASRVLFKRKDNYVAHILLKDIFIKVVQVHFKPLKLVNYFDEQDLVQLTSQLRPHSKVSCMCFGKVKLKRAPGLIINDNVENCMKFQHWTQCWPLSLTQLYHDL